MAIGAVGFDLSNTNALLQASGIHTASKVRGTGKEANANLAVKGYENQQFGPRVQPTEPPKNPFEVPTLGEFFPVLTNFEDVLANCNMNPHLSFMRGEAGVNMALGETDAIAQKGGHKAGVKLNTIV